ncbi:MAG: M20/M25/M40 family metallo-hydrolase [bacterium]|nr:M20/M25/M40 family metallo-hydrolase [bacterium]
MATKQDDLVSLLQDIIRIASWVDYSHQQVVHNENKLISYLIDWLKQNTNVEITKQRLPGGRFNLICKKGRPEILYLAHTDTVAPSINAEIDQLRGLIKGDRIYGRGATDMKSGLASLLWAIKNNSQANNYWACFYADEEYFFLGMKSFVQKYSYIRPKYIISADGSDLALGHGCRGLIELKIRVRGVAGHAAKGNGLNAIEGVYLVMQKLKRYLKRFYHLEMGNASVNLAYLLGGAELLEGASFQNNSLVKVGQAGNVIPDIAEFIVDIRPSSPVLTAKSIAQVIKRGLLKEGYQIDNVIVNHDLGAWYTDKKDLQPFLSMAKNANSGKLEFASPAKTGYLDLQLIWSAVGRPTAIMFGGGEGSLAHRPDEHIRITSLNKTYQFFDQVMKNLS